MRKYILFLSTILIMMPRFLFAAQEIDLETYQLPEFIWKLPLRSERDLSALLKIKDPEALMLLKSQQDEKGYQFFRYRQTYQGVPVFARQVILVLDSNQQLFSLTGSVLRNLDQDLRSVQAKIRPETAITRVLEQHDAKGIAKKNWYFEREKADLVIYLDDQNRAHLAYVVSYFADTHDGGHPTRPYHIISAEDGRPLRKPWDGLTHYEAYGHGGNLKTGKYSYGIDMPKIPVTKNGNTCLMDYDFGGFAADVRTVNLNHGTQGSQAHAFTCPLNTVKQINGAYSPINDAQFFSHLVSLFVTGQQIFT